MGGGAFEHQSAVAEPARTPERRACLTGERDQLLTRWQPTRGLVVEQDRCERLARPPRPPQRGPTQKPSDTLERNGCGKRIVSLAGSGQVTLQAPRGAELFDDGGEVLSDAARPVRSRADHHRFSRAACWLLH